MSAVFSLPINRGATSSALVEFPHRDPVLAEYRQVTALREWLGGRLRHIVRVAVATRWLIVQTKLRRQVLLKRI